MTTFIELTLIGVDYKIAINTDSIDMIIPKNENKKHKCIVVVNGEDILVKESYTDVINILGLERSV